MYKWFLEDILFGRRLGALASPSINRLRIIVFIGIVRCSVSSYWGKIVSGVTASYGTWGGVLRGKQLCGVGLLSFGIASDVYVCKVIISIILHIVSNFRFSTYSFIDISVLNIYKLY